MDFTYTGLNRILRRYEMPRIIADVRRRATDRRGRMNWRIIRKNTRIDDGSWITRQWQIRLPIFWDYSSRHASRLPGRPPEIRLNVGALPLERRGLIRGVGRVPGNSTDLESD